METPTTSSIPKRSNLARHIPETLVSGTDVWLPSWRAATLIAVVLLPSIARAVQVSGAIADAGSHRPVASATVSVVGETFAAIADSQGRYLLDLPAGLYQIEAGHIGYKPRRFYVELMPGERTLLDVVLTATALPQPVMLVTATSRGKALQEVTVPVEIVEREAIEMSGADNVAGLLEDVTGLAVHSSLYGYLGSPSGVMIQGIDPSRVLVLMDGKRLIGGPGGMIDLSRLPVAHVERIEVVKGPHSALYGSEAMGGVVHILTRNAPSGEDGDVRLRAGSGGMTSGEVRFAFVRSRMTADLSASATSEDAVDCSPDDPDTDLDAYTQRQTQAKLRFEAHERLTLRGDARWLYQREEGFSSQFFAPLNKTYVWRFPDRMHRIKANLGGQWRTAGGETVDLSLSRTWFDNQSVEELIDSPQTRNRITDNRLTKLQLRATRLLRSRHIITAGAEYSREDLEISLDRTLPRGERQFTVEVPHARVSASELYVQDDWQVRSGTGIVLGARYQHHSRYGSYLTPKISFAHKLTGQLRVRASYGQGYRAPSLKELHYVFDHSNLGYMVLGRDSLQPERSWGLNLGAEFRPTTAVVVRANLFRNRLRNLIQTVYDPEESTGTLAIYAYDNVGRAMTRGVELGIASHIVEALNLNGGYTYLEARDQVESRDLAGRPRHSVRLRATLTIGESRFETRWRHDSPVWADAETTLQSPASSEWDLQVERVLTRHLTARLGVQNLLNRRRDTERSGDLRSVRGRVVRGGMQVRL